MTTDIAPLAGDLEGIDDAHHAAEGALAACALGLVTELSDEVRQLKEALDSNRRIGMAMGLVMGQLQVTDEEAFDALRRIIRTPTANCETSLTTSSTTVGSDHPGSATGACTASAWEGAPMAAPVASELRRPPWR